MATLKNNLRANAFPQVTDDTTQGYEIGSLWFYGNIRFQCTSATANAAAWSVVGGAGLVKLASGTLASAATLDIVLTPYTAFRGFRVLLAALRPATDAASLWCRTSTDGGANYASGATDYKYSNAIAYANSDSAWGGVRSTTGDTKLVLGGALSNDATGGWSGAIEILDNFNAVPLPTLEWDASIISSGFIQASLHGGGFRNTAQDTDALRFMMSSGAIATGKWTLLGYA